MAEEQRWQEAGGHTLCANNCGFFGCPTTRNLCSKCYKDLCLKEHHLSQAKLAVENSFSAATTAAEVSSDLLIPQSEASSSVTATVFPDVTPAESTLSTPLAVAVKPNRCATCRRRVGLTGFTCRCGTTFCGTHRYPEKHGCTFDFKTLGKEAIEKANPLIKADKLEKI